MVSERDIKLVFGAFCGGMGLGLGEHFGETFLGMEDLYAIITIAPFYKLRLGVSRLLTNCVIQYLSFENGYSHPAEPFGKQKRLSFLSMLLLRGCIGSVVHTEENHALLGQHVSFAKNRN